MKEYFGSVNDDRLPIWKGSHLLTPEEQAARNLVLGIKCRIDKSAFRQRDGFLPEEKFGRTVERLAGLNLISNTDQEMRLTYTGRLFAEEVGRCFEIM